MIELKFTEEEVEMFREALRLEHQMEAVLELNPPLLSTRDLVVLVYPQIVEEMAGGETVRDLVERFCNLEVDVTESTLTEYIEYARQQVAGNSTLH